MVLVGNLLYYIAYTALTEGIECTLSPPLCPWKGMFVRRLLWGLGTLVGLSRLGACPLGSQVVRVSYAPSLTARWRW